MCYGISKWSFNSQYVENSKKVSRRQIKVQYLFQINFYDREKNNTWIMINCPLALDQLKWIFVVKKKILLIISFSTMRSNTISHSLGVNFYIFRVNLFESSCKVPNSKPFNIFYHVFFFFYRINLLLCFESRETKLQQVVDVIVEKKKIC